MTPFDRGDVVLLSYPTTDSFELHLRPVVVIHTVHESDTGVAVAPISPELSSLYKTIPVSLGTYEAARMGLLASGYLTACEEIIVDRQFIVKKIGQCPWQLLAEFLDLQRQPMIKRAAVMELQPVIVAEDLAREAI